LRPGLGSDHEPQVGAYRRLEHDAGVLHTPSKRGLTFPDFCPRDEVSTPDENSGDTALYPSELPFYPL